MFYSSVYRRELKTKNHCVFFFRDLLEALPNVAEQVVIELKQAQQKYDLPVMYQATEANLKQQIIDIGKPEHKVKEIISTYYS